MVNGGDDIVNEKEGRNMKNVGSKEKFRQAGSTVSASRQSVVTILKSRPSKSME